MDSFWSKLSAWLFFTFSVTVAQQYPVNWTSLDARPLPLWYDEAKFGIFCHWGVYSVPSYNGEWFWTTWAHGDKNDVNFMNSHYRPGVTYQDFAPEFTAIDFNATDFGRIIKSSGAKYFVITTKHHEGYTLWPNKQSWNWNAMDVGPGRDLLAEIRAGVLGAGGVRFGTYFSLFAWYHPLWNADQQNNTQVYVDTISTPQLKDLISTYQPDVLWVDGDWLNSWKYWKSDEFIAWLYNESPVKDSIVTNDRWGMDTNCVHGGYFTCHDGYNPGQLQSHKWENANSLTAFWGFSRNINFNQYMSLHDALNTLITTISAGGNLLLNIAPDHNGRILPLYEERLRDIGLFVNAHSEAIFATKPWIYLNEQKSTIWYTSQLRNTTGSDPYRFFNPQQQANTIIYAFITNWPLDNTVTLTLPKPTAQTTVKLFSTNGQFIQLNYTIVNGAIQTSIARINKNKFAPSSVNSHIFVLKIEYTADDNNNPIPVQSACQTCQLIMTNAANYYTLNNAITQSDLQTKVLSDCGTFAISQDQNSCKTIVNKDFSKVYNDLKGGKNYGQVCDDLGFCSAA